jgi:hypothetical protein
MLGRAILCAAVTWIAACGSDSTTNPGGPSTSPVGNYAISTVNGKGLPFTVFTTPFVLYEVTAGTIGLTTDGKYSLMTTYRQTISAGNIVEMIPDSSGGTWVLSGTTINLTERDSTGAADGASGQITWSGTTNQLTFAIVNDSAKNTVNTFVYTKK